MTTTTVNSNVYVYKGREFAERFWFSLAKRILKIAGEHYKWDEQTWDENINLFLRSSDYSVIIG
jgi:hypothetical protein